MNMGQALPLTPSGSRAVQALYLSQDHSNLLKSCGLQFLGTDLGGGSMNIPPQLYEKIAAHPNRRVDL